MRSRISRHLSLVLGAPAEGDAVLDEALVITAPGETPLPPPELNGRDYTIFLLRLAAEVEHGLMVQYLFAAYSFDGTGLADDERADVRAWQETLLGIAKEEMAHLITVENILSCLSAPLNFNREEFPHDTLLYPFGFNLRPASLQTIAAYVCAESPADWEIDDSEEQEIKAAAKAGTGGDVNRVGRLYAELHRVLSDASIVAEADFGDSGRQASWDEWGRGYRQGERGTVSSPSLRQVFAPELLIEPVTSRATAVLAIERVGEQGEGLEPSEVSHFQRLLDLYRGLKALGVSKAVRPLAPNPTTDLDGPDVPQPGDPPPDPDGASLLAATAIGHPEARLWAHLFNVRYRKLLVNLAHGFELPHDGDGAAALGPRGALIHRTFSEMYNLRAIAGRLVVLPIDEGGGPDGPFAGPPFQIPHTLMLPTNEAGRWRLHRDLIQASRTMIAQLRPMTTAEGRDYLAALAQLDAIELAQTEDRIVEATSLVGGAPQP